MASLPGELRSAATAAESKAYAAEASVAWVRFAVIFFNVPVYWIWIAPQGVRWLAITISVVAALYAIVIVTLRPYRRYAVMKTAAWTAVTDSSLIVLWIHATGGYDSPYYLLWYLSLFAITFRYDARATFVTSMLYAGLYTTQLALTGAVAAHVPDILIRDVYILLVGSVGSVLARESLRVFTERFEMGKQMQETERFRALAEANPDAVGILMGQRIAEANDAFCRLLGRPRDDVVGRAVEELANPEGLSLVKLHLGDPTTPRDHTYTRPDGATLTLRAAGSPIQYRGQDALFVSLRDVTSERAAEETRRIAMQAEMEVKRLQEVDRFKTDFINTAAHELNTPLTPIKIQLHLLRQRLPPEAKEERHAVDVLGRNLDRLGLLVQDMLDVARLQSGRLSIQPAHTDVAVLVRDACEMFQHQAKQAGITLTCRLPGALPANADGKRITQVLFNLLSNAIKFTPRGGTIEVVATYADGMLDIAITDTGAGLSADQLARLFQPFAQVHRDILDVPGTGLGLYISKGILERHGGGLTAQSPGPGRGATFRLRIPGEEPARFSPKPASATA